MSWLLVKDLLVDPVPCIIELWFIWELCREFKPFGLLELEELLLFTLLLLLLELLELLLLLFELLLALALLLLVLLELLVVLLGEVVVIIVVQLESGELTIELIPLWWDEPLRVTGLLSDPVGVGAPPWESAPLLDPLLPGPPFDPVILQPPFPPFPDFWLFKRSCLRNLARRFWNHTCD